ncbi:UNVERIFIED_CONTAM: protein IQ-DOMAIN 14 [Sesamum angustifolium]|uniref:Protein IQ-DOMAIN 14 n=1 Tax=Sesamum angustifolium TaxID=2727405 RepID=A0AAW2LI77_9LAMI
MGKNNGNSWLNAVKKAFRSAANHEEKRSSRRREENDQEEEEEKKRGKRRWIFRKHFPLETTIQHSVAKTANSPAVAVPTITGEEDNLVAKQPKVDENSVSERKRAMAVAMATTAAAEAAVATAHAAVEFIRLTRPSLLVKEHKAAVVIQTIFRGYLARRALLALKGVVKLQALIRGHNVRRRAKMTLQCIQSLVRVQAQVCDQRRRLSCEATSLGSMFSQANISRKSTSRNESSTLEEIEALIEKAKECSLRHGKTLAHVLSQQMWTWDGDQISDNNCQGLEEEHRWSGRKVIHPWVRKDGNLCNQRIPVKTVEIDTSRPYSFTSPNSYKLRDHHQHDHEQCLDSYFVRSPLHGKHQNLSVHSPKTPSSSKIKPVQVHSRNPSYQMEERNYQKAETPTPRSIYFHRMSISENSCPLPRPNYMAATASAIARVRSHSSPRQRTFSSPSREQTGSAKKRLSFPVTDGHNGDNKLNIQRYKNNCATQFGDEQIANVPYYLTE